MRKAFILLAGLTTGMALAQVVRPTVSGTIQSASGNRVTILTETGTVWTAEFQPNSKCEWMGRTTSLSAVPKGAKVMLRVVGSMADKPLKVDLLSDWGSSNKYVASAAPVPYYTRKGDMAGPGGVGGRPDNAPDPGKPHNIGGYAVNGGMPHQNQPSIPNLAAPAPQNPGVAQMSKGTPGFETGPIPPPPAPGQAPPAQPQQPMPNQNPAVQPDPAMYNPGMNPSAYQNPYAANPSLQPGVMNPYMAPNTYNPNQTNGLESLLNNSDDPSQPDQGGPMFPGMSPMGMGSPVYMQATVLRCDPATRSLVVQPVGTQVPQNVVVNPQMMMPMLREGQTVTINGTSNPQGFIEAQQVTPLGQ